MICYLCAKPAVILSLISLIIAQWSEKHFIYKYLIPKLAVGLCYCTQSLMMGTLYLEACIQRRYGAAFVDVWLCKNR